VSEQAAAWVRLDRPGRDAASLRPTDSGWLLQGAAAFDLNGGSAAVAYRVEVDARWQAKGGLISALLGGRSIRHEIRRDDMGWRLYERRSETSYWYEAPTVPYQASLEIAPNGFVRSYPGLWRLVA
jgi:hypothetical protein